MPDQELMPSEVFQPGKAEPTDMYVARPTIESELAETTLSDKATLMIGGAGSGKSWLYRRLFTEIRAEHSVLSVTRNYGTTIRQLIDNELSNLGVGRLARQRRFVGAGEGLMIGQEGIREFDGFDALLSLSAKLRRQAGKRPAYIVVENCEQGLTDTSAQFVSDLINMIMATDQLAKQNVKLLIVGADDRLGVALANSAISGPHMRRLRTLPEVSSFTEGEALQFLDRGFRQKLGIRLKNIDRLVIACRDATDLRPDLMSEYCLLIAKASRNRLRVVEDAEVAIANQQWSATKLSPYIQMISGSMNTRDTRKRVRDKMLYALAHRAMRAYTRQNITDFLRAEFPKEDFKTNEIATALEALCADVDGSIPLLRNFGTDNSPMFGFAGATERVATAFALNRNGDDIRLNA